MDKIGGSLVWLITGCSRGLGLALCKEVLARGDRVVATARDVTALEGLTRLDPHNVIALPLDVKDRAAIAETVEAAEAWSGGIDVLVNNAGRGMHGAVEEISDADSRGLFDINVFGLLSVTRAVLPGMRSRRRGHVVNMSSIAGLEGAAGTGLYSATKFAVEGLSEAMAQEVGPLGIGVTIVEPGPFRTDFNGSSLAVAGGTIADYGESSTQRTARLRAGSGRQAGDPAKAATLIYDAVRSNPSPLHLLLGKAAYERFEGKTERFRREISLWRDRATNTDFDT